MPSLAAPLAAPLGGDLWLVSAVNPAEGIIIAMLNVALIDDDLNRSPASWSIEAIDPTLPPITITEAVLSSAYPERVLLRFAGGDAGQYRLTLLEADSVLGVPIDPDFNSQLVDVTYPPPPDFKINLFDTAFGPIGLAKRSIKRRSIDQLVANRALAVATNTQIQLRLASTDGTAGRDGRPGANRG